MKGAVCSAVFCLYSVTTEVTEEPEASYETSASGKKEKLREPTVFATPEQCNSELMRLLLPERFQLVNGDEQMPSEIKITRSRVSKNSDSLQVVRLEVAEAFGFFNKTTHIGI